jgi:hypothetical protein
MENGNAAAAIPRENNSQIQPFQSKEAFTLSLHMANELARSTLVPVDFRGEVGRANCLIAIEIAGRLGISPFMTMQNMYVIHGKPTFSATFLIGMINASGRFTPLQYEMSADNGGTCVAYAKDKRTGEVLEGPAVSVKMAESEGWATKSGSKWKTMPDLMLRYRAATFFARTYCPEMTLGMQTREEIYDVGPGEASEADVRKINAELLGKSDSEVVDVETLEEAPKEEPAAARKAAQEAKKRAAADAAALEKRKAEIADLYKKHFGAVDLALADITLAINKPDIKTWTARDVDALHKRLRELRTQAPEVVSAGPPSDEPDIPDFGPPASDAADAAEEEAAFL